MQYLSVELRLLRSEEFASAEPSQQATWLKLLAYCADQENGGMVRDALKWRDRECAILGFARSDLDQPCGLWTFKLGHLYVFGYSLRHEQSVVAKRKGGVKGSRRRWNGKVVEMPAKYQPGTE